MFTTIFFRFECVYFNLCIYSVLLYTCTLLKDKHSSIYVFLGIKNMMKLSTCCLDHLAKKGKCTIPPKSTEGTLHPLINK